MVKEIFRNYDIRGVYGQSLFEPDAYKIGQAFGSYLIREGAKSCAVGYDNRLSSLALSHSYRRGLLSTGIHVIDLGECLTPLVKFYVYEKKLDAGTSVTASHNAAEYNGFKLILRNGTAFFGESIQNLYTATCRADFIQGVGTLVKADDLLPMYRRFLSDRFTLNNKGLKIALNCGNGTASNFAPGLLRDLGVEVLEVNCESDGSFPNGAPDPERKDFMDVLKEAVQHEHCSMGIGLDGDSDRFGLIDETGEHYESDKLMMLLAKYLLRKHPGGEICCDIKCSSTLLDVVKKAGGTARIIKTGYPYHIPEAQGAALFSAELSGHFFMGRTLGFYGLDDGIVSACMMLQILSESGGKTWSELMVEFPKRYHTAEVKIDCDDAKKWEVVASITAEVTQGSYPSVLTIDGVRVHTSDTGWFLLRASNTSPCIVARVEGADQNEVTQLKSLMYGLLELSGLSGEVIKDAPVYFS